MTTDKTERKTRNLFVAANKYQKHIIILVFLPSLLIFLAFNGIVFMGNPAFSKAVFHASFPSSERSINLFSEMIVIFMCSFFLLSLFATFIISHNMIGGFERITKELDVIISGKSQRTISSRPNDTLTKELLKRINILAEYYIKNKK